MSYWFITADRGFTLPSGGTGIFFGTVLTVGVIADHLFPTKRIAVFISGSTTASVDQYAATVLDGAGTLLVGEYGQVVRPVVASDPFIGLAIMS